jgi:hypothetical protein
MNKLHVFWNLSNANIQIKYTTMRIQVYADAIHFSLQNFSGSLMVGKGSL